MNKNSVSVTPEFFSGLSEYLFLDTARSSSGKSCSYLFLDACDTVAAFSQSKVLSALEKLQRLSQKYWVAGYIRYEAAGAFLPRQYSLRSLSGPYNRPLLWFGIYEEPRYIKEVRDNHVFPSNLQTRPTISYSEYQKAIKEIKFQIKAGNTYQVNYTFDVLVRAGCSAEFLYFLLRRQQQTPYCAMIKNSHEQVLSFSPELFFERDGDDIWTKPMKGTAPRGISIEIDQRNRDGLGKDVKNRAENLMIVDLLRNDLGRICRSGTVGVPSMFDVETHPTVHQMTSLITGVLKGDMTYADIFKSLFPCGSVTGAPKLKTIQIIDRLEKGGRGIYCGAIGYISPQKKAVFSVPIRILQKGNEEKEWRYRVGSGIVWDSNVKGEWEESGIKTKFLTAQKLPPFELLETMFWDGKVFAFEQEHIQRLKRSAAAFKFSLKLIEIKRSLNMIRRECDSKKLIVRLLVSNDGQIRHETFPLKNLKGKKIVNLSPLPLDRKNMLLRHKITYRPWYEEAMEKIRQGKIWDEIFINQYGEVCEGARSNVFVEKNGKIFTPPVSCGLLPGIFREDFLKHEQCEEKVMGWEYLKSADAVYCGNSVRGLTRVEVL